MLLFVAALTVIVLGAYLLIKDYRSKTTLKITSIGEISTTSLGLVVLLVGAVLVYFCLQADEKSEAAAETRRTQERQTSSNAVPPASSLSVSQSSTGDGSPNIVNGSSVTSQIDKSRNDR